MDPDSLLSQLRDIHGPEAIGVWPPAIGWFVLIFITVLAIVSSVWVTVRWYRSNAWRRVAMNELKKLKKNYQQTPSPDTLADIVILLKRCVATVQKNNTLLAVTGKQWQEILCTPDKTLSDEEVDLLCHGHYQAECAQLDDSAFTRIETWIRGLKP